MRIIVNLPKMPLNTNNYWLSSCKGNIGLYYQHKYGWISSEVRAIDLGVPDDTVELIYYGKYICDIISNTSDSDSNKTNLVLTYINGLKVSLLISSDTAQTIWETLSKLEDGSF